MLIRELVAYAQNRLKDRIADPAFETKPVRFLISIAADGTFLGILEPQGKPRQIGKKEVPQAMEYVVPKSPVARNSPTVSFPLLACDDIKYVLGVGPWTEADSRENSTTRHLAFVALIQLVAGETKDAGVQAARSFYAEDIQVSRAREALGKRTPKSGDTVGLSLSPAFESAEVEGPVFMRPDVQDWWRDHYRRSSGDRVAETGVAVCLACGQEGPITPTHDKIKGLAGKFGGQSSGVSLMSFDKDAFRSHGWPKNANSPTCPECASAYTLALNQLLEMDNVPRTRVNHGGVAFVFWTRQEDPGPDAVRAIEEADPAEVEALLKAVQQGGGGSGTDPNLFFCLAMSGNGGRLLVRDWFVDTISRVQANVASWFRDLAIADVFSAGLAKPPKLWEIVAALARQGAAEDVPDDRQVHLIHRALYGTPLGRDVLAAALGRLRVETGSRRFNSARMGLIRLCVNDVSPSNSGVTTMPESLSGDLSHPAFICGRLLAVYDSLQYQAQDSVNVTVVDRYWSLASTYPCLAFPKIEDLGQKHLRKLRRDRPGAAVNIEKEIQKLHAQLADFGAKFPGQLSLEDQGRFAIGFHLHKAQIMARATAAKEAKAAAGTE